MLPFLLLLLAQARSTSAYCEWHKISMKGNLTSLKNKLEKIVSGDVYDPWTAGYEKRRKVHSPGCCERPSLIVVPENVKDVSTSVKFSKQEGLPLSVRSGGHSYLCSSLKDGSLHIDLRNLNKVKLIPDAKISPSGMAAIIGAGSTWGRVLEEIPSDRYTMVHGQCLDVGVGGYIQGGGAHGLGVTARHGLGVHNVLQMEVVLADGSTKRVTDRELVKEQLKSTSQIGEGEELDTVDEEELMFAFRGAGSSFGIITRIVYQVFPVPETLTLVVPIYIDSYMDFVMLEKAALSTKKYLIAGYRVEKIRNGIVPYNWLPFDLPYSNMMSGVIVDLINLLGSITRTSQPVLLTIVDVSPGAGRHTEPKQAVDFLKRYNIKVTGYLFVNDYVSTIMSPSERMLMEHNGNMNVASASSYGLKNPEQFANVFFNHPVFGHHPKEHGKKREERIERLKNAGCYSCFWTFYFENHVRYLNLTQSTSFYTKTGTFMWDLSCLFQDREARCPTLVGNLKRRMDKVTTDKLSELQYINTPSCNGQEFGVRYWGENYPRLLKLKKKWDPDNVFHHCQSVGSTDLSCCPFKD